MILQWTCIENSYIGHIDGRLDMKKKITIISCVVVAILLCIAFIIGDISSLRIIAKDISKIYTQTSEDDEKWKSISSGNVTIENERIALELSSETAHFTVTEKTSGKAYYSVAQAIEGFEPSAEQQSEVTITYYDSNSAKINMNSFENSIEGRSYEVKTNGSAIRVYYSIQKSKQVIFVPDIIGQKVFEEELLPRLQAGPKRRLKGFYTFYEAGSEKAKALEDKYPVLEEENLYVLNDTAGEHNYSEITGYMQTAEYNQDRHSKELEKLGLEGGAGDNQPAAFMIPVEYTLTDGGFSATVLTDRITSSADSYKLTNISLLPYFGSCGGTTNGWFLVPDGSGAIIELAHKSGNTYSQGLWGTDAAVESSIKSNIMQNAGLPVFAAHNGSEAFFAEVTGAAAIANVSAAVFGNEITQNHIYADFNILSFDTSDMGEIRNQAVFNIYDSQYVTAFPQVTYTLFTQPETTYSDMANAYREELVARGTLGERLKEEKNIPIYFDFTGYVTTEESFLGIPIDSKEVLTTVADMQNVLKELEKRQINGVHMRLKGYANGGMLGTVSNGFAIEKKVGNAEALQKLAKQMKEKNGTLYLENNLSTVFYTGNSFEKMTHAVRSLKKTVAEGVDFDLVARTRPEVQHEYFMTSPVYFRSLTENFINILIKESGDVSDYGYSWSDFGSKLWSDFHTATPCDRTESVYAAQDAVSVAEEAFDDILTDGSNSYVLSQVSTILNMPLQYSAMSCESYSVPFYQMVVHGYVDYSGAPINTGLDLEKTYLASIESGANLYYSFYTAQIDNPKEVGAGKLIYPTYIGASYDVLEAQYAEFSQIFNRLRTQVIRKHERVAEQLFVTTYEDGTRIAVNYGEKDMEINEGQIPARGFAVLKGGDE